MLVNAYWMEKDTQDHFNEFEPGVDQMVVSIDLTETGTVSGPHFIEGSLNIRGSQRISKYKVVQRDFHWHDISREEIWWQQGGTPAGTSIQTI